MKNLPRAIEKYLRTRAIDGPWQIAGSQRRDFAGAVVIPALAESAQLPKTLSSLAANPPEQLRRFLVLVVVNNRADTCPAEREDNLKTLALLQARHGDLADLQLAWVDAASPGRELEGRNAGVGLARKIGFDLSLERLDFCGAPPLLVSLDADTLVRADYLQAISSHFERSSAGAAVIPFCHQRAASPAQQRAIDRYELYLRAHLLGLTLAGSPYAFHTIGSALACRAEAYARMGGMNRRQAGEDFYFLQQLAKTCGVDQLRGTLVYPSARPSARTPFGTGPSVARQLAGEEQAVQFYPPQPFRVLARWLELVACHWDSEGNHLRNEAEAICPHLGAFLDAEGFCGTWQKICANHLQRTKRLKAFHDWFDGLKTTRLIHYLCDGPWPRVEPEAALPALLQWAKLAPAADRTSQLELLRIAQQGTTDLAPSPLPLEIFPGFV